MKHQTNGKIKILKGRPMPNTKLGHGNYPLKEMKAGDSFDIVCESKEALQNKRMSIISSAKYHSIKVATRHLGKNVLGVWRIS